MNRLKLVLGCAALALTSGQAIAESPIPSRCIWFTSQSSSGCNIAYAGNHLDVSGVASTNRSFTIDAYAHIRSGRKLVLQCSGSSSCIATASLDGVVDGTTIECVEHGAQSGIMMCASW